MPSATSLPAPIAQSSGCSILYNFSFLFARICTQRNATGNRSLFKVTMNPHGSSWAFRNIPTSFFSFAIKLINAGSSINSPLVLFSLLCLDLLILHALIPRGYFDQETPPLYQVKQSFTSCFLLEVFPVLSS